MGVEFVESNGFEWCYFEAVDVAASGDPQYFV